MSLRLRLLVALVALAAVGLLVADVATFTSLRSFLNQRVEQQLQAARFPVLRALVENLERPGGFRFPGGEGPGGPGGPGGPAFFPSGTYGQLRDADGRVLGAVTFGDGADPPPKLPSVLPASPVEFTASAAGRAAARYRVLAQPLSDGSGGLVVAVPLREMRQTLGRLFAIELGVGIGVLVGMGMLAWWVVRLGLRPLEEIEGTASEIAAGDLTRRVERAEPRTEVGRLGLALNAMLAQIERAFAERQASEDKLRRFLADASHELRTPLTSIRGYSELFRRGADTRPDDLAKAMSRIERESDRMGVLVDDLLLLARLDQGRPLERGPVDLAALAADAVHDARAIDTSREISLDSPSELIVPGDEIRLRQVAGNLLSNALTHTPPGTPVEVRVSVNGSQATLEVTDHGPGLLPDDADRVFERFYRSDPSRARESGGAGLGLSIVAAIAEAHGGTVDVSTAPGEGATFRVSLPLDGEARTPPHESPDDKALVLPSELAGESLTPPSEAKA